MKRTCAARLLVALVARSRRRRRHRGVRRNAHAARGRPMSSRPIGTLWVNAIRMTVIPLVVSLLITGVASAIGPPRRSAGMGARDAASCFVLLLAGTAALVDAARGCRRSRLLSGAPLRRGHRCRQARPRRPEQSRRDATRRSLGSWLVVARPGQPDRRRGQRRDGAADRLHAAPRARRSRTARRRRGRRCSASSARSARRCSCWCAGSWRRRPSASSRWCCRSPRTAGRRWPARSGSTSSCYSLASVLSISLLLYPGGRRGRHACRCAVRARGAARRSSSPSARAPRSRRCRRSWRAPRRSLGLPSRRDAVRAAARGVDVQDRGAGLVDGRRALRRLVLRRSISAPRAARHHRLRGDLPLRSSGRAFRAARSSCWRRSFSPSACRSRGSAS